MTYNVEWNRAYYERNAERIKARSRKWYQENKERAKATSNESRKRRDKGEYLAVKRAYYNKCRSAVLNRLGGRCVCCGITDHRFLAIDHINGGGKLDRKLFHANSIRAVEASGYDRTKYQVLCHNCNMAKGFYGVCPHAEMSVSHG